MSERTFRRCRHRYQDDGLEGLAGRLLGKASARRVPADQVHELLSCSRSSPWARRQVSGMRRTWWQTANPLAGGGASRRRVNKLSCAGWLPHDRGFV
jgi:hypothetical protein